jgi:hypothetical protein
LVEDPCIFLDSLATVTILEEIAEEREDDIAFELGFWHTWGGCLQLERYRLFWLLIFAAHKSVCWKKSLLS